MKLLTFHLAGKTRPGVLDGDDVIDLAAAGLPAGIEGDLRAIVAGGDAMLARVRDAMKSASAKRYRLGDCRIMAPIFSPSKIVAVGLNYIDHCKEANLPVPSEPVLFAKFPNSITGPYDDLSWPESASKEVDYEVELGVVIGKGGRDIPEAQALDHVCGYTVVNDVSARDLQFANAKQWDRGKSLDTFCPYGPYIVTRDEIPDPQTLQVRTVLNGQEMQISNTRNMVFGVAKLISYMSEGTTLMPGDLIPTGTPFGVGFSRKPPVYLKDGDECVCEVEKVGAIRNRVRLG
ncbi:MAG: fumarylacetoacetate hydrolase protein 2-like isoform [Betaproteobacteria bacterium]|nr:fumarylacetoacetate hydrolase protein 2-like isoform [Betaproteobacteria bacterium]